jgi:hypothetical protein
LYPEQQFIQRVQIRGLCAADRRFHAYFL